MARRGLNQGDIARILGVTQSSVSEKLRGKIAISITDLITIAAALEISLADLLGEGILNAKIPSTVTNNEGNKEEAPIGFIPNGASYDVVAGARFELATSGL
ncbi:helix-turn-helix domain-containing protein [Rothia amarae]